MKGMKIQRADAVKLCLAGALAGFVNGFLGAGGGIVTVMAISKILKERCADRNTAFSTALCIMLPLSGVSAVIYAMRGNISFEGFGIFAIPAVIGGALGGLLLGKLKADIVKKLFSALVVVSGILLIVR